MILESDIRIQHQGHQQLLPDPVTRHFFNGFVRLHILYHAAKEPIYGAEIAEELVRHGYRLSQGTLYPTLHLLEQLGYLRSRTKVVNGKVRKYYQATLGGRKVLVEASGKLQDLVSEIIENQDQPFQVIRRRGQQRRRRPRKQARRA
jgi:PadR family transcriptional regulator PadR